MAKIVEVLVMNVMKHASWFGPVLALGIASAATTTATTVGSEDCAETARAQLQAEMSEAWSAYWLRVASCRNDAGPAFPMCYLQQQRELEEDLALAEERSEARLEVCALLGGGAYDPDLDPTTFSTTVDNPFLPHVPGRTLVYEKATDEGIERVEVTTLDEIVAIDDFRCRVVHDVESLDGQVVEDTVDWIAQAQDGAVWYFGEIAQNYEDGLLDNLDGSWRTGVESAKPGVLMLATPEVGDVYRQEYLLGEAEDLARVVALDVEVTVPAGTFPGCLQTEEWAPLSPGNIEYKFYAPGVGLVLELDPRSGKALELIEILN